MRVEPRFAVFLVSAGLGLGVGCVGCGGHGSGSTPRTSAADAAAGSACGNTQVDPHNCGACGHSCQGGACQAGACVPLAPGILASGQQTPAGIVVDANNVYWVNRGTQSGATGAGAQVLKCAKSGCSNTPTVLAAGTWTGITNLAIDGTNVYWGASGKLFACPTHGCSGEPTVLWSGAAGVAAIALSDAGVYFDMPDSEQVTLCSTTGCDGGEALTFDGDGSTGTLTVTLIAIAADQESLYAVANAGPIGTIVTCAPSHCAQSARRLALGSVIGIGQQAFAPLLAVDDTNLYFVSFASELGGLTPPGLMGIGPFNAGRLAELNFVGKEADGGSTVTLLGDLSSPSAIAVDGTAAYVAEWGEQNDGGGRPTGAGRIDQCAVAGCKGVPVVVQGYVNYPQGIAVDDANVYWTDFGSGTDPTASDDGRVMFRSK